MKIAKKPNNTAINRNEILYIAELFPIIEAILDKLKICLIKKITKTINNETLNKFSRFFILSPLKQIY